MMTKERADHLCEILQAMAAGVEVEESFNQGGTWHPHTDDLLGLNEDEYIYRINPREPRELLLAPVFFAGAKNGWMEVDSPDGWAGVIKVREVIE